MKLKFSPVRKDEELRAFVRGDVLTLNDVELDFSQLPDGGILPSTAINSEWIASDVTRVNGEVHLTIIIPHGEKAPHETLFPIHFAQYLNALDGEVQIPQYNEVMQ